MSDAVPYANYQYEIYLRGMANQRPARTLDWRQLERDAYNLLTRGPRGYIQGGAGLGETMRANREAFDRWRILPRMLRDVSERSLVRTVLGAQLPAPVLLAPIGVQTLAHPEGELAVARAAARTGVPLVTSSAASHTIEQIAQAAAGAAGDSGATGAAGEGAVASEGGATGAAGEGAVASEGGAAGEGAAASEGGAAGEGGATGAAGEKSAAGEPSAVGEGPAAGELPKLWYQLYWPRDRELARSFVTRAAQAGYGAIVVTLDTWLLGWRPADLSEAFLPFLWGEGNRNYLEDPVFRGLLEVSPEEDMQAAVGQWAWQFANPSVTWQDLAFLRECTDLPIVLKGILHPEDARLAVEHGVEGILVSNHGGRQVDGSVGALDALPGVVAAVDGRSEVLFDSGIRSGADALKALALGARAVLLGRPYIWGLALGGEEGVVEVLRSFLGDLDLAMALSGYANIDEVDANVLVARGA